MGFDRGIPSFLLPETYGSFTSFSSLSISSAMLSLGCLVNTAVEISATVHFFFQVCVQQTRQMERMSTPQRCNVAHGQSDTVQLVVDKKIVAK